MEENFVMPKTGNVTLSKHVRIIQTNSKCRGCDTKVRKYIDTTPDEMLGKYLCNCVSESTGELTGPHFPLFQSN